MVKKAEREAAYRHSLEELIQSETGCEIPLSSFDKSVKMLSRDQRRHLRRTLKNYERDCSCNCMELRKSLTVAGFSGLRSIGRVLGRGAAAGVAVAGVVNTVAPGLYYVGLSSLARVIYKMPVIGGFFTKIGLITVSLVTPPQAAQSLILVVGGVIGIIVYALYTLLRYIITRVAGNRHAHHV